MEIDALRAFALTVERGSLSAAAAVLNVSEPALSRRLSQLEGRLGLALFDRSHRSLRATEIGRAFLDEIQPVLSGVQRIEDYAADLRAGVRRRVRLVSMPRLTAAITTPVAAEFSRVRPDVFLSIDIQPRRALETWITGQRFDLGLSTMPAYHRDIDTQLLFELPAVAIVPVGHPLDGRGGVTVAELMGERMIALGRGALLRAQVKAIFDRANLPLEPVLEVSQAQLACHLVAVGAGITIGDPLVPTGFDGKLACVPIVPRHTMAFGLHFLRGREMGAETRDLVEIVRAQAEAFVSELGFDH